MNDTPKYFCTAADNDHYRALINLISSIHKHDYESTQEIAVFNLGLDQGQMNNLAQLEKVKLYSVHKANPLILEPLYNGGGRWIKGLFSWKPVVIKQALQLFPYVVYADAGTTFQHSTNDLFNHVIENNYFLSDCGHSIRWMTTNYVINKCDLNSSDNEWIMADDTFGIDAGFLGITKEMESSFVNPIYQLSKDIHNFLDDGTCPQGWGTGRHDQTLFSIQARKLKLNILNHDREVEECFLSTNNKKIPFHITHLPQRLRQDTAVFRCRRFVSDEILNSNLPFLRKK